MQFAFVSNEPRRENAQEEQRDSGEQANEGIRQQGACHQKAHRQHHQNAWRVPAPNRPKSSCRREEQRTRRESRCWNQVWRHHVRVLVHLEQVRRVGDHAEEPTKEQQAQAEVEVVGLVVRPNHSEEVRLVQNKDCPCDPREGVELGTQVVQTRHPLALANLALSKPLCRPHVNKNDSS